MLARIAHELFDLGFALAVPLTSVYLIDQVIANGDVGGLAVALAVLLVVFLVNTGLTFRRNYLTQYVTGDIVRRLRLEMFARLQELSHAFYAGTKTGDILTRMTTDIQHIEQVVSGTLATGAVPRPLAGLQLALAVVLTLAARHHRPPSPVRSSCCHIVRLIGVSVRPAWK